MYKSISMHPATQEFKTFNYRNALKKQNSAWRIHNMTCCLATTFVKLSKWMPCAWNMRTLYRRDLLRYIVLIFWPANCLYNTSDEIFQAKPHMETIYLADFMAPK